MWHTLTHRGTYTHHSTYSIQAQRLKDTNTTPMHLHTHTHRRLRYRAVSVFDIISDMRTKKLTRVHSQAHTQSLSRHLL